MEALPMKKNGHDIASPPQIAWEQKTKPQREVRAKRTTMGDMHVRAASAAMRVLREEQGTQSAVDIAMVAAAMVATFYASARDQITREEARRLITVTLTEIETESWAAIKRTTAAAEATAVRN
jgi:hypothetical protein